MLYFKSFVSILIFFFILLILKATSIHTLRVTQYFSVFHTQFSNSKNNQHTLLNANNTLEIMAAFSLTLFALNSHYFAQFWLFLLSVFFFHSSVFPASRLGSIVQHNLKFHQRNKILAFFILIKKLSLYPFCAFHLLCSQKLFHSLSLFALQSELFYNRV